MPRNAPLALVLAVLAAGPAAAAPDIRPAPLKSVPLGCDSRPYGRGTSYAVTLINGTGQTIPRGATIVVTTYSKGADGRRKVVHRSVTLLGDWAPNTTFFPFLYTEGRSRCDAAWSVRIDPRKAPRRAG
jgi:hypothetical protein